MTETNKQERREALERQIHRLQRRIALLEDRSNRYSWIRVALFFGGVLLSVLAYFLVGWWLCGILAIVALAAFSAVAYYQGKIDRSARRHRVWQHIKEGHLARMRLAWDALPNALEPSQQANHPFENDLDITGIHSLHRLLNVAVSREGSQRLRNWLLNPLPDLDTIRTRQALVRELTPLSLFRDKLTLQAMLAARSVAEQLEGKLLLHWLNQQNPATRLPALLAGATALSVLTLLLFALNLLGLLPQYWILSLLCSGILFFTTKNIRGDLFDNTYFLRDAFATLSSVFAYLEAYPYGKHTYLKKLCEPFFMERTYRPSVLARRIARMASASTLRKNTLLWIIINVLVPWDTYCAYRLRQYQAQVAQRLPTWLYTWFELEALNSLATFAYLNPGYVLPQIEPREDNVQEERVLFRAFALGHPLLPDESKVTNDFTLHSLGEIIIITGSNMSGKSTFLRTLGINLCLAYAGAPVNASLLQTTLFRLFTCIRVNDSVTDGYSYFYAEVKRLKALLDAVEQNAYFPVFFLIDEIFRGTNNRERLTGSRAYVRALSGKSCVGGISTHDLELVKLAETLPQVRNDHFREEVIDGQMVFDYVLRPGPSPTTNALKIMQMEGLPIE